MLPAILAGLAAAGAGASLAGNIWGKKSAPTPQRMPLFTAGQEEAMNKLRTMGMSGLENLGTNPFAGVEDYARAGFANKTIPSIMERFGSMGGSQLSSGLPQILGGAGADLEGQLAQLKSQQQAELMNYYGNLANMGLQRQFEPYMQEGEENLPMRIGRFGNTLLGATLPFMGAMGSMNGSDIGGGDMGAGAWQNVLRGMSGQQRYNYESASDANDRFAKRFKVFGNKGNA